MYQKNLEYLGLSEKEATLYYALLQTEAASAVSLSRKTGIKQPTVYVVIEQLVKKGLAREVIIGKRTHFSAESPENLKTLIEKEKNRIENKIIKTESIIAELKTVDKEKGDRPNVRFYEGREALKQSVHEYVSQVGFSEKMDYGIYSYEKLTELFNKKDLEIIETRRIKNNVKFRAIYSGAAKVIESSSKLQELIKVDQGRFPLECDIAIFNDEVHFHTQGKSPSGVVIKNQEIATTLKSIIDYVFSVKNG